jgi:hypothetical protein
MVEFDLTTAFWGRYQFFYLLSKLKYTFFAKCFVNIEFRIIKGYSLQNGVSQVKIVPMK